jgi:hypothetical protein
MTDLNLGPAPDLEPQDPVPAPPAAAHLPAVEAIQQQVAERAAQEQAAEERQVLANFRNRRWTPDAAAEAQRVSFALGLDPAALTDEGVKQVALKMHAEREVQRRRLATDYPLLAAQMRDLKFVEVASDDLDNLTTTETHYSAMGAAYRRGQLQNELGLFGAAVAARVVQGLPVDAQRAGQDIAPEDRRRYAELKRRIDALPESQGIFANTAEVFGQMVNTMPVVLAAAGTGAVVGSAVPGVGTVLGGSIGGATAVFSQTAAIEGGAFYLDMRDQGFTHDEAIGPALVVAVVNGVLEVGGVAAVARPFVKTLRREIASRAVEALLKPAKAAAGKALAVDYVTAVGGELTPEVLQELTTVVAEEVTRERSPAAFRATIKAQTGGEILDRLLQVGGLTLQAMLLLGAPGSIINYAHTRSKIRAAEAFSENLKIRSELAAKSKTLGRAPGAYHKSTDDMATANGIAQVFIEPAKLSEILQQAEKSAPGITAALREKIPAVIDQIEPALRDGELVAIPTADYVTHVERTPLQDLLAPHLKESESAFSQEEAKARAKEIQAFVTQTEQGFAKNLDKARSAEDAAAAKVVREEAKAIEQDFYAQLTAAIDADAGIKFTKRDAQTQARILTAVYVALARSNGMTPKAMLVLRPPPKILPGSTQLQGTTNEPRTTLSQEPQTPTRAVPDRRGLRGSAGVLAQPNREAPLEGLPATVAVGGKDVTFGPLAKARQAAHEYAQRAGIAYHPPTSYVAVDPERAGRIAQAFEVMRHDPTAPDVAAAYEALITETLAQWQVIKATGLQVEFIEGADPYALNPRLAMQDIVENNHFWVFPTDAGFGGTESAAVDITGNPLLRIVEGETISGKPVRANDIFRIVHDYFGHAKEGVGFRARGEENAWQQHMAMYSPLARRALTSETRGQNSWVNFGPFAAANKMATAANTQYAPQKIGLLPDWAVADGYQGGDTDAQRTPAVSEQRLRILGLRPDARYGTPRKGSASVVGAHFSKQRRETLAASAYGTGAPGAESRRVGGDPVLAHRVHFYVDTGSGIRGEPGVGDRLHAVQLDNVYDLAKDPLGIVQQWRAAREAGTSTSFNDVESAVHAAGFDGVYVQETPGSQGVAVLIGPQHTAVPVQGVSVSTGQLMQEGPAQPLGGYAHRLATIFLNPGANASTPLHEMLHFYASTLFELAVNPAAPAGITQQVATLLKFVGVADLAAWNALSAEAQRPHHEALAYAFETYLAEGKTPSREMQSVFDRILAWMRLAGRTVLQIAAIYKREFGQDLPALTPELRRFFDLLFASEDQIVRAEAVRGQAPLFLTKEQATKVGVTDAEWQAYQELLTAQREAAAGQLTVEHMKNARWLQSAVLKSQKHLQARLDKARAKLREEVAVEVQQQPTYFALARLRDPKWKLKLDRSLIGSLGSRWSLDEALVKSISVEHGGQHPDVAARMLGFANGDDMLRAFFEAPPLAQAIETATDARIRAEETLADPEAFRTAVERAVHNDLRERVLAVELKMLAKSVGPSRVTLSAAKAAAQRLIARTKVGDLRPSRFLDAEVRAAVRAREALQEGDAGAAVFALRQQLLQNQMARLAGDAQREVERAVRSFRPYWRGDLDMAKTRSMPYVQAARAILAKWGLGSPDRPAQFFLLAQTYEPTVAAELQARIANAVVDVPPAGKGRLQRPFAGATLEAFRTMRDEVHVLWHQSEREASIGAEGHRIALDEAADRSITALKTLYGDAPTGPLKPVQDAERRSWLFRFASAGLKRVEHWARKVDGGADNGPLTKFFFRPLRKAFDNYMAARVEALKVIHGAFKALKPHLSDVEIDASDFVPGLKFNGTVELLGALQHAGNKDNLRKLLLGYKWVEKNADGSVDTDSWWTFIRDLMDKDVIRKEHLDYLQTVWDFNEAFLAPLSQKVMRTLFGTYWAPIPAQSISTPWGNYRGGYMPAKPDPDHPDNANLATKEGLGALHDIESTFRESMPGARPAGHTIARTGATRPLVLDLRVQLQHLDEVLRFVHLQPAIRDAAALLKHRGFSDYLNSVDRSAIRWMLLPMLEATMRNQITKPSTSAIGRLMDKGLNALRRSTGLGFMFGSVRNALQQASGISNVLQYVPARYVASASSHFLESVASGEAVQSSKFMALRLRDAIGQIQDDIDLILDPSWMGDLHAWTSKHGYALQRLVQSRVDLIAWHAAFEHKLDTLGAVPSDEVARQEAIDHADSVVRLSQGSQTPIDVADYERSGALIRLMSQFSGYYNTVANQIASAQGFGPRTAAIVRALIVPALLSAMVAHALSDADDFDDQDGNGTLDEYFAFYARSLGSVTLAMIPVLGPAAAQQFLAIEKRPGDRITPAPFWSVVQAAGRLTGRLIPSLDETSPALLRTGISGTDIRDAGAVFTALTGVPVTPISRAGSYLRDVALKRVQPGGPVDFTRGLITGR